MGMHALYPRAIAPLAPCNMSRFSFLRQARIWFNRDSDELPDQEGDSVIILSDQFYKEVIAHPVPTDLEAVRMLNSAPAALDLFVFLSYRCFVAKGPESIPIFGHAGLASQIGCGEYARPRTSVRSSTLGST